MDNEEGVQEQMKADLSALKDQMASISEVMLKLQKSIEDKAIATASSTVRDAEPVLQPALNPGLDRNTAVFGRRYSPQAYPYGLPPDFTPCATPEDLSQAPTFEGQLPPYEDYPGQDDGEGDTHLGPLLHLKDPSPHELPQPNIVRHIPASPTPHPKDNFPPIPMAYSELWPSLLENHLVVAIPGKVLQPPYPKWYDPSAKCVYHSGVPGHNIDSCIPFKYKVQHLISVGWLAFQEEGPNVKTNPLASHRGASVNAVEGDGPSRTKRLGEVATSRRFIYQSLQAACMVSQGGDERDECLFHLGESHNMETCPALEELLQRLMDCGQLEVSIGGREEPQICMQSEEKKVPLTPKALVICFARKETGSTPIYPRAAPKPTPFAYQSNKVIPWMYTPPVSSERVATEVDSLSAKVTNITGLSGVTRSGRVFASPHPAELPSKGKAPMVQEPTDIATPSKEVDPPVARGAEKKEGLQGKTVTLEEAHEFLRLIQQSENGFEPGMGLGKDCLGNADVVDIKGNPYKYGLGYEPGMLGRRNVPSRFRADRVWPDRISQCFTSSGMVSEEEVAAIEEEFPQDPLSFVQPCHPDSQVGNWRVISQSEVYTADSMYMGMDASGDRVMTDRSLPFPGAKKAESIAARQPSLKPMLYSEAMGHATLCPFSCNLCPNEMAPRKLASKRSRKDKAAEGTSSAPEYDSHRFRSAEHQQRFEAIKGWSFLWERRVQLRDDEYTDFQEEIVRRRWASLVTPMAKFDPDIVLEFYANAWPTEEGLLGYPLVLKEGQECEYGQRRNRSDGFDEEAIAQLLCIPGQDFAQTAAGRRVRIMRTNMTTLTQIWMTLLLSNVLPSDHNSDLPLPKCQLVYAILTRMSIHDSASFGVPVAPSKVIRPPITRAFIEKYYTQRQVQGDAPQAADAPPPHQVGPAGSFDTEQYLRHLVRQQAANHRAHVQTHDCLYQMSLSLQSQGFISFPCPTPDQFRAEVAWPGDWPEAQAGEAPAEAPDEADEAREDEEMTDLLDFLGGSGAT
ncbi:hypothetical protein HKD37_20G055821 [Glycine soja]